MKNQSNLWTMLQMLVFTFLSLSGIALAVYGIYQFAVVFVIPVVGNVSAMVF